MGRVKAEMEVKLKAAATEARMLIYSICYYYCYIL